MPDNKFARQTLPDCSSSQVSSVSTVRSIYNSGSGDTSKTLERNKNHMQLTSVKSLFVLRSVT